MYRILPLKKSLYTINTVQKKNLYLTVLVLSPRFQNVTWWAGGKKNTGKTAWEEEGSCLVHLEGRGGGVLGISLTLFVHVHTQDDSGVCTLWMGRGYFGTLA